MILENITISVSQKKLNCLELYSSLMTIQIPCKVSSNLTITNSFGPENGANDEDGLLGHPTCRW